MEYNKRQFKKTNDKKILHKIKKHWVVISASLLLALGGGAYTSTNVHASAPANNANHGSDVNLVQSKASSQPGSGHLVTTNVSSAASMSAESVKSANVNNSSNVSSVSASFSNSISASKSASAVNVDHNLANSSSSSSAGQFGINVAALMHTFNFSIKNNPANTYAYSNLLNQFHTNQLPNLNGAKPTAWSPVLNNVKRNLDVLNKTLNNPVITNISKNIGEYAPYIGLAGLIGISNANLGTIKNTLLPFIAKGKDLKTDQGYVDAVQALYDNPNKVTKYNNMLDNLNNMTNEDMPNQDRSLNTVKNDLHDLAFNNNQPNSLNSILAPAQSSINQYLASRSLADSIANSASASESNSAKSASASASNAAKSASASASEARSASASASKSASLSKSASASNSARSASASASAARSASASASTSASLSASASISNSISASKSASAASAAHHSASSANSASSSSSGQFGINVSALMHTFNSSIKSNPANANAYNGLLNQFHTNQLPNLNGANVMDWKPVLNNVNSKLSILNETLNNPVISSITSSLQKYTPYLSLAGLIGISKANLSTIKNTLLPLIANGSALKTDQGYVDAVQALYDNPNKVAKYNNMLDNLDDMLNEDMPNQDRSLNNVKNDLHDLALNNNRPNNLNSILAPAQSSIDQYLASRSTADSIANSASASASNAAKSASASASNAAKSASASASAARSASASASKSASLSKSASAANSARNASASAANAAKSASASASAARSASASASTSASISASASTSNSISASKSASASRAASASAAKSASSNNNSAKNASLASAYSAVYSDSYTTAYNSSVVNTDLSNVSGNLMINHDKNIMASASSAINNDLDNYNVLDANQQTSKMSAAASNAYNIAYSYNYSQIYNDAYTVNYYAHALYNLIGNNPSDNYLEDSSIVNNARRMIKASIAHPNANAVNIAATQAKLASDAVNKLMK